MGLAILMLVLFLLKRLRPKQQRVVAFLHPFTNDGGGGEKVLWCAMRAIQEQLPGVPCAVYTGDKATPESLQERALHRFGVQLHSPPMVVSLRSRRLIEDATWPRFTLIGQSLGSIFLGIEALWKLTPVLFVDTSGYAFTYFVAKVLGCKVACYTHYPTISTDMLSRVASRSTIYNNSGAIARSSVLSSAKLIYYKLVAFLYGLAGRCSDLAMVNSSWTRSHIRQLWGGSSNIALVYPPCSTEALQEFPLSKSGKEFYFISVAQFRPEKNHVLQLEAFSLVLNALRTHGVAADSLPKLKLVGSCRNQEDESRLQALKAKCVELGIQDHVSFSENVSYRTLQELLAGATAGLHSMTDEHFGISVVEYMAAGAIPIAHDSAGPKLDIVVDEDGERTGFLASTAAEFSDAMVKVFLMSNDERINIAKAARRRAARFSENNFYESFKAATAPLVNELRR